MKKNLIYSFKNNRVLDSRAVYYNQRRIDKIIDGLMQELEDATATGESISVTDSANAPAKLLPSGRTEQAQYEGYNLVDVQTMTISGGNSAATTLKVPIDANTDYYYYDFRNYQTTFNWGYIEEYDSEDNLTQTIRANANNRMDLTFLTGLNASYLKISSPVGYNHIIENPLENNIMLTKGTIKKSFEPYVGGQPSPSLNYPQQIHVVKGHNEFKIANADETEFQTFPLDLPEGMEMCKISNYVSTFEKADGKWYITPHFKIEIDNADNVTRAGCEGKAGHYFFKFGIFNNMELVNFNYKQYGYINYGKANAPGRSTHRGLIEGFNLGSQTITLYTEADSQLTLEEFKAKWNAKLANVPLVIYAKSSLTNIEITDQTLISQLDKMQKILSHFGGTTITTITAGDLNPILNFDYKKSNRLRDDNQDKEIENIKARLDLLEG